MQALVELLLQSERAPAVRQAVGESEIVAPDGINPEVLCHPYDACYVALAWALRCPLVTGDRRLSRVPGLGVPLVTV